MEKGKHALTAIEGLWRALWNSPPPHEVVEALKRGEVVWVKRFDSQRSAQEVVVEVGPRKEERPLRPEAARIPKKLFFSVIMGQGVLLEILPGPLIARWGRVFMEACTLRKLKEVLEGVRLLVPLLSSMGLEDLEEALKVLATLEDGEARMEGAYTLIRKGSLRVLGRGALFGDPILDCEFMAGNEVAFSFPVGVAISLKGDLKGGWMRIREGYIRWKNEVSELSCAEASHFVNESSLGELLRCGLLGALSRTESLRMRALIEKLLERGDPLEALKEEGFIEQAEMDLLAEF
jgi:hypothetical protein